MGDAGGAVEDPSASAAEDESCHRGGRYGTIDLFPLSFFFFQDFLLIVRAVVKKELIAGGV